MSTTISPNMSLIIPGVGTEPGPEYAQDINTSLTLIDSHDHTSGSGVPITPDGLNISSDLTFLSNNAIDLRSARFTPQGSPLAAPADLGCLYESGVDLYYNDGAGNQIRLTQGGSIVGTAGSISGLPSGTASASFAGGTFVWEQSTDVGAFMDSASVTIREPVASGEGVTLQTITSLSSSYTLTLPLIPASQKFMTLDASGNMSAPYAVDGSTITISSNIIKVPDGGINTAQLNDGAVTAIKLGTNAVTTAKIQDDAVTTDKILDGAVTPDKVSTPNVGTSSVISATENGNDFAQSSITQAMTGRLAMAVLYPNSLGGTMSVASGGELVLRQNGVTIKTMGNASTSGNYVMFIFNPAIGTNTYILRALAGGNSTITNCKLSIIEIL